MNQSDFEADLWREGYQVFYGGLKADEVNTEHSHDWHARVMVIGGEITITRGGKRVQQAILPQLPAGAYCV
jgi:hypothetical protein